MGCWIEASLLVLAKRHHLFVATWVFPTDSLFIKGSKIGSASKMEVIGLSQSNHGGDFFSIFYSLEASH